jgi:hypothetical protein
MSDFLFRMVERAAGISAATTPQPPRELHWPVTERPGVVGHESGRRPSVSRGNVENPLSKNNFLSAGALPEIKESATPASFVSNELKEPFPTGNRSNTSAEPGRKRTATSAVPAAPGESVRLAAIQRDHTSLVQVEAAGQPAMPSIVVAPFAPNVRPPAGGDPGLPQVNGESIAAGSEGQAITGESDEAAARSSTSIRSNQDRVGALQSSVSTLAEVRNIFTPSTIRPLMPRETVRAIPEPAQGGATPEPLVEVKIGRVEIRFDSPVNTAPPPGPAQPRGFDEYAALRTYAVRPWPASRR